MARLIVGLGNPGGEYARNRHNVGFMAVDRIHDREGFPPWRRKFRAEVADGTLGGTRVTLMKPATWMNLSGEAVGEAVRFFKLDPADVLVVHDEIDLPPGKFRVKTGGGAGGHNGLRSIIQHVGDGFRRLRIGVGHPGRKDAVPRYVLKDFAKADAEWLEPLLDAIADEAAYLARGEDSRFANKVHLRLKPAAPAGKTAPAEGAARPGKAGRPGTTGKAGAAGTTGKAGGAGTTDEPDAAPPAPDGGGNAANAPREEAGTSPFAALKRLLGN